MTWRVDPAPRASTARRAGDTATRSTPRPPRASVARTQTREAALSWPSGATTPRTPARASSRVDARPRAARPSADVVRPSRARANDASRDARCSPPVCPAPRPRAPPEATRATNRGTRRRVDAVEPTRERRRRARVDDSPPPRRDAIRATRATRAPRVFDDSPTSRGTTRERRLPRRDARGVRRRRPRRRVLARDDPSSPRASRRRRSEPIARQRALFPGEHGEQRRLAPSRDGLCGAARVEETGVRERDARAARRLSSHRAKARAIPGLGEVPRGSRARGRPERRHRANATTRTRASSRGTERRRARASRETPKPPPRTRPSG